MQMLRTTAKSLWDGGVCPKRKRADSALRPPIGLLLAGLYFRTPLACFLIAAHALQHDNRR